MTQPPGPHAAAHYELRIEGHLDPHWSAWFGGLTLIRQDDGTTTLRGAVTDQAELHGLLTKVRDLGITLISVASIESIHDPSPPNRNTNKCLPRAMRLTHTRITWATTQTLVSCSLIVVILAVTPVALRVAELRALHGRPVAMNRTSLRRGSN